MHIDMDAFFASVEQRDHPEYLGCPVVVGAQPGKRGVVAACSYEARRYGIRSAMPISEAYRRCPDAVYLRPSMARYSEASRRVMVALEGISPVIEQVSVDEAYVDISGLERLFGTPRQIGERVRQQVKAAVDLTCSVGIGPNRLIAKLASDFNKPDGLTFVPPEQVYAFLDPMPVSRLRGVGKQTLKTVQRLGIRNVAQLRGYSLESLQHYFGNGGGEHLYHQARGIASDQVGGAEGRKSISKETTFNQDVTDTRLLRERLRALSSDVGATARREGLKGRVVTFKLRLGGFETLTRQCRLAEATDADSVLFTQAWQLYTASGQVGKPVRLIGLGITGWEEGEPARDLFDDPTERQRQQQLYAAIDQVKDRFGRDKLALGVESPNDES
ncbi:MAG: DNA polymerase IV [Candidatus Sedimenticola sp. (ex Thyasira tokunagai)]